MKTLVINSLIFFCIFFILNSSCKPQSRLNGDKQLNAIQIKLPAELEDPNQQFSGLYIANDKLYLLPECRLQDKQEAALYSIELSKLQAAIDGDIMPVTFQKIPITGLQYLRDKMKKSDQVYEGTEAMAIFDNNIVLSIETTTPSSLSYLLKGQLLTNEINLDTSLLLPIKKPVTPEGKSIFNASFESIMFYHKKLYCFFEYNSFSGGNYVYTAESSFKNAVLDSVKMPDIPFRITDITSTGENTATAINFFYKGEGEDEVYRPEKSSSAFNLVHDSAGFKNYNRLLGFRFAGNKIDYHVIGEFPSKYWSYNWEGIAAYKDGYFIINDKYTDKRPYKSTLLYITK